MNEPEHNPFQWTHPSQPKKRKRGAQKGNRNARKHGLYTCKLTPEQTLEQQALLDAGTEDAELAAIHVRIHTMLRNDPFDENAREKAVDLLLSWTKNNRYGLKRNTLARIRLVFQMALTRLAFDYARQQHLNNPPDSDHFPLSQKGD